MVHYTTHPKLKSEKALASPHRRLKRKMIEYKGVWLDSTWELILAKRLDEQLISWIRPDPLKWIDERGKPHHYFADFYLLDFDLYLDPKNPQAYKKQINKIRLLQEQYSNILVIRTLDECKSFTPTIK